MFGPVTTTNKNYSNSTWFLSQIELSSDRPDKEMKLHLLFGPTNSSEGNSINQIWYRSIIIVMAEKIG